MHELVISSSLKTSPWGNHPVIWDFSSCLVDGAILWVFPESAVVLPHLQPDVPLGIRLAPNSLPLELRPLPSMISSSWPQFSSRQPDRWKHLELPRKFSNTSAVPGGYWLSPHPHHVNCTAMLLNSVFVPVHGLSDLLKTQIFFLKITPSPKVFEGSPLLWQRFFTRSVELQMDCSSPTNPLSFYTSYCAAANHRDFARAASSKLNDLSPVLPG